MKASPLIIQLSCSRTPNPNASSPQSQQSQEPQENPLFVPPCGHSLKPRRSCIVCRKQCCYKCPKCNKFYCSIEHYRSHNLFCSEAFYQQQVKQKLKATKTTSSQEKKKVIQMVKQSWQIQQDQQNGIVVERLQEMLNKLSNGQEVQLNEKEKERFNKFVRNLEDSTQVGDAQDRLEVQKMYWEVEDGLGVYLTQDVEIQQYDQHLQIQNGEITQWRQTLKFHLQQFLHTHPYKQQPINPILYSHLLQLVYTYILLNRMHNGQENQFIPFLVNFYTSKNNQNLLKNDNVHVSQLISGVQVGLQGVQGGCQRGIVLLWVGEYCEIVAQDLRTVFSNKLLITQTLLRLILQTMPKQSLTSPSEILEKVNTRVSTKWQKNEKKVCKKSEYLLYFVYHFYKKQICQQYLDTAVQCILQFGQNENKKKLNKMEQMLRIV